jgi:hypothetical protein|tara:strand:+ start:312 stop:869 length:558 start_codon:yes stop_codon:yes gene_type:complete
MAVNSLVLDQLRTDPSFAVDFIIDNNPQQVQAQLSGLNLLTGSPQEGTRNTLRSDVRAIDDEETLREVLAVPYVNEASNYTGGYQDSLNVPPHTKSGDETSNQKGVGIGLSIIDGIFNLGGAYFASQTAETNAESAAYMADAQLEAANIAANQEERNKILGFPPQVFMVVMAVFALVVLLAFFKK